MDYSKVKYVKPSVDGLDITKDKVYKFKHISENLGETIDNSGYKIRIRIGVGNHCCHLPEFGYWIPCTKDGTPLYIIYERVAEFV